MLGQIMFKKNYFFAVHFKLKCSHTSKKGLLCIVSRVAVHEAPFTQKFISNQAFFLLVKGIVHFGIHF